MWQIGLLRLWIAKQRKASMCSTQVFIADVLSASCLLFYVKLHCDLIGCYHDFRLHETLFNSVSSFWENGNLQKLSTFTKSVQLKGTSYSIYDSWFFSHFLEDYWLDSWKMPGIVPWVLGCQAGRSLLESQHINSHNFIRQLSCRMRRGGGCPGRLFRGLEGKSKTLSESWRENRSSIAMASLQLCWWEV